jgi:hypothetical protein
MTWQATSARPDRKGADSGVNQSLGGVRVHRITFSWSSGRGRGRHGAGSSLSWVYRGGISAAGRSGLDTEVGRAGQVGSVRHPEGPRYCVPTCRTKCKALSPRHACVLLGARGSERLSAGVVQVSFAQSQRVSLRIPKPRRRELCVRENPC